MDPWDDTPICHKQQNTFLNNCDSIWIPITSNARKSCLPLPILDTISENDERYEQPAAASYLNQNSSNQEASRTDNIYLPVLEDIEEAEEVNEDDGYIYEENSEDEYFYEEDEYEQRAYPNGHPVDRAYNTFVTTFTKREKDEFEEWLRSISEEESHTGTNDRY